MKTKAYALIIGYRMFDRSAEWVDEISTNKKDLDSNIGCWIMDFTNNHDKDGDPVINETENSLTTESGEITYWEIKEFDIQ